MRAIMTVLLLAASTTAQEKKADPVPKNDQLITLLKEVRAAKDRAEAIEKFVAKQDKLNDETVAFVNAAKGRPDPEIAVPAASLYIRYVEHFLKAKRLPEAAAALNIVDDLYDEKYSQMNNSSSYFKAGFLAQDVTVIANWQQAVGNKARASTLYYRAIDCWRQRLHYDIANTGVKGNEEAVQALRDKIKKIDEEQKK